MNLEDWITEESNRIREFRSWWIRQHATEPDSYPTEMPQGEWDEQYRLWEN